MSSEIDKFFDKIEGAVDKLVFRKGQIGVVPIATVNADDKPVVVWHFALYRIGLVCNNERQFTPADFKEAPPRGGYLPFCIRCIRLTIEELKDGA